MSLATFTDVKSRYDRDGFFLFDSPLFPAGMIDRAVEGMDAIRRGEYETGRSPYSSPWNPGDNPNVLCKIEQSQRANRAIYDLISSRELGEAAAAVTGASMVQVWWVQLLYKPSTAPGNGPGNNPPGSSGGGDAVSTAVGWHQDRMYWDTWQPGSELFTAWIALSDVAEDCGPMKLVPGSHRWGLQKGNFFAQDLGALRAGIKPPEGQTWSEVAAILPAGGVSFHDNFTIHGSMPNVSGRPRRSFAVHLRTQNSAPAANRPAEEHTQALDDPLTCPVIYRKGQP